MEFILADASKESLTTCSFCANGFNNDVNFRHGVKVGPGAQDPPQSLKVGPT